MASMVLRGFLPKSHQFSRAMGLRSACSARAFVTNAPGPFQSNPAGDTDKPVESVAGAAAGVDSKTLAEESSRGIATATAKDVNNPSAAASRAAQDLGYKAKQTAQEAWGSTKATAQKVKDTVLGNAEEGKESIKDCAETVKSAMNTKNR